MNQKIKINSAFGNNLRRLRKRHGYTQEQIVAKLQLKNQDISRSAYAQIASQDKSAPVMGHTQSVVAGLTYGRHSLNESLTEESPRRGFCV